MPTPEELEALAVDLEAVIAAIRSGRYCAIAVAGVIRSDEVSEAYMSLSHFSSIGGGAEMSHFVEQVNTLAECVRDWADSAK